MASEAEHASRRSQSRLPAQIQKREPAPHAPLGSNGTLSATAPRGGQAGASIKTRRQKHECNELCACAYPPQDPQRARSQREMAAPAIAVERFRVEHGDGFTMPVVSLTDRRAAGNRLVRFCFRLLPPFSASRSLPSLPLAPGLCAGSRYVAPVYGKAMFFLCAVRFGYSSWSCWGKHKG